MSGTVDGITFGTLVTFIEYMRRFFAPINDISAHYGTLQSAMASSERIFDLLDTDLIIPAAKEPEKAAEFKGALSFDNISFAYNDDDYILKDVSFSVAPGEKVALVGATGAGKTSIIKLLNRLYDVNKGSIKIDGIDIRDWELKELRQTVGVVLQDVFLFTGTMASNIRLGDDRIPDNIVKWAATQVNAHEFISRLPAGYFEEVKERGHNLSVGQRQLLSFARALAYDPSILVLDEATSSVDTETEKLIEEALLRLMKGRTSIVIAHRLSTIKHVDRIIVLHKGEVREIGTHAELMARKGIYHRLYQLQYRQQEKTVE
jgi:ABC-type multidrug transport system fused ATPase/permease subunit